MPRVGNSVALRGVRRACAARRASTGGAERLLHDLVDGTGTAAALRTTAETAIDLPGRARRRRCTRAAHGLVAENIAGADDHRRFRQRR